MSFEYPTRIEKTAFRIEWALSGLLVAPYLRRLDLRGHEVLLEVGCGGGAVTKHLSRLLPSGRVVGVDPSEYWVACARSRLRGRRNVDLLFGDVLSVDLAPDGFDAVLFHYVLHEIAAADRPSTLDRVYALLKEDGRLLLREPTDRRGMRPQEIRKLMESVGLREESGRERSVALFGRHFDGVFRKV
jgi:ubiquinone/menaquinone biosynthesis C-methylase UbiE